MLLLGIINKLFKAVVKILASILGFVLFRLYLWVPAAIAVVFLVASAAVPFNFDDYTAYFIVLVIAGAALSAVLCLNKYLISPVRRIVNKPKPLVLPAPNSDYPEESVKGAFRDRPPQRRGQSFVPMAPTYPPQNGTRRRNDYVSNDNNVPRGFGADMDYYEDRGQTYTGSYGVMPLPNNGYTGYGEVGWSEDGRRDDYPPAKRNPDYPSNNYYEDRDKGGTITPSPMVETKPQEQPKLYRTRKDPTLFIAEYSDKLEYYRKTLSGDYLLVSVEDKPYGSTG